MRRNQNFGKVIYGFRLFEFWIFFPFPFFSFAFLFAAVIGLLPGLLAVNKCLRKSYRGGQFFTMEQLGVVAGNLALSFSLCFWAFLCIFQAPMSRSLWTRHHWEDLFLLRKLSVDDANFGQKWWRQKWKKGLASSRVVMGGTVVRWLKKRLSINNSVSLPLGSLATVNIQDRELVHGDTMGTAHFKCP